MDKQAAAYSRHRKKSSEQNKTQKKSSEIKLILCLKLMLHMGAWGKNGLEAKILKKTQAVKISPYSKHKDAFVS